MILGCIGLEAAYKERQEACERAMEELSKSKHLIATNCCYYVCMCQSLEWFNQKYDQIITPPPHK